MVQETRSFSAKWRMHSKGALAAAVGINSKPIYVK
jgi:hypothetical protein